MFARHSPWFMFITLRGHDDRCGFGFWSAHKLSATTTLVHMMFTVGRPSSFVVWWLSRARILQCRPRLFAGSTTHHTQSTISAIRRERDHYTVLNGGVWRYREMPFHHIIRTTQLLTTRSFDTVKPTTREWSVQYRELHRINGGGEGSFPNCIYGQFINMEEGTR